MLFFAGIVMLVSNPSLLLYDPSFQLSFIATLGLILLSKPLEHLFVWMRSRTLGEITTATIATQIAVLPLLIFSFGEVSLVALPVNLLVLPTVPLAMLLGFLTGVAGVLPLVSVLLAPVLGALAFLVLSFELLIVDLFARIPLASVSVPPLSLATVLLLYALLGFALWKMRDSGYTERAA